MPAQQPAAGEGRALDGEADRAHRASGEPAQARHQAVARPRAEAHTQVQGAADRHQRYAAEHEGDPGRQRSRARRPRAGSRRGPARPRSRWRWCRSPVSDAAETRPASTSTDRAIVAAPTLIPVCSPTPCASAVQGELPSSARTISASPAPKITRPAASASSVAGEARQREARSGAVVGGAGTAADTTTTGRRRRPVVPPVDPGAATAGCTPPWSRCSSRAPQRPSPGPSPTPCSRRTAGRRRRRCNS